MSAFDFMNKTKSNENLSSGLSSLLIEDIYDSQLDTFVNQSKPTKSSSKEESSNYFSMIDDFAMSTKKPEESFEKKSAFAFMSPCKYSRERVCIIIYSFFIVSVITSIISSITTTTTSTPQG